MTVETIENYVGNVKQNGIGQAGRTPIKKFWQNIRINEWTFSLFLFVLSLAIVAGKLFVNYGHTAQWPINVRNRGQLLPASSRMYNVFGLPNSQQLSGIDKEKLLIVGEKVMNVSREYGDAMAEAFLSVSQRYIWLVRAVMCGLAMMGFTWFIIYKDSSIPGVNPPSPFSPSKKRYPEKSRLQINYVIGVLNGILIFVYMCL